VQIMVLDPAREISAHVEANLAPTDHEVVCVHTLRPLSALLAASTSDDVLLARVPSEDDGVETAACIRGSGFLGATFLIVDHDDDVDVHRRLGLSHAESIQLTRIDALLRRLTTNERAADPVLPRLPFRRERATFHGLVGRSKQMLDVFARIEKAAAGDANVCIYGESGTGKELIARAIHEISDRHHGPLITFDCTAVPEGLAESQLFGHVRGAFTGAIEHRDGVFSQANKGTLFIDELCELSPPLQAKLLRVIQSREFVKVGGTKPITTNIRLVTATNKDPKKAVDAGSFRADLYYRVAVVMIRVPPLRDRREDIPMLVEHFIARYAVAYKKPIRGVQPSAMERMINMAWPGNVRQLENFLAQAVVLADGDMLAERDLFVDDAAVVPAGMPSAFETALPLREVERRHILSTLQRAGDNRTEAARILGISVRCLQYKLKAYGQTARETPESEERRPMVRDAEFSINRVLAG
jgi:two-component system, NtrC family, response regulator HydG